MIYLANHAKSAAVVSLLSGQQAVSNNTSVLSGIIIACILIIVVDWLIFDADVVHEQHIAVVCVGCVTFLLLFTVNPMYSTGPGSHWSSC